MGNTTRLFVDLIRKAPGATGFPNLDPPERVEVGDYGYIDRETGLFRKQGNIYDPSFAPGLDILEKYPPMPHDPEDKLVIVSKGAKWIEVNAGANANLAGLAGAAVRGSWKFQKRRGAVLVMIQPTFTTIPGDVLRPKLQHIGELAEKALVTGVYSCPMYALLLTDSLHAEVAFAWQANDAAGIADVGGFGKWMTHSTSGTWRCGGEKTKSTFFPLFRLETPKAPQFLAILKSRSIFQSAAPEGDSTFRLYPVPWGLLDEEGDEMPEDVFVCEDEE